MAEYSGMLKRALEVGPLKGPYDPKKPPLTAQEYLQFVVLEAASCKEVVVADIDRTQFQNKRTPAFECPPDCARAPASLIPNAEWQRKQVANFSVMRMVISRYKALENDWSTLPKLPEINDEQGWMNFCLGNTTKTLKESSESEVGESYKGKPPYLSTVLCMNQPTVERVLEYQSSWLEGMKHLSHEQGRWLYALMAALQLPLTPEVCFVLRHLARQCAHIRSLVDENDAEPTHVTALNLFICLVAHYFRQSDLADVQN